MPQSARAGERVSVVDPAGEAIAPWADIAATVLCIPSVALERCPACISGVLAEAEDVVVAERLRGLHGACGHLSPDCHRRSERSSSQSAPWLLIVPYGKR